MSKRTAILYQCDNPSCVTELEHDSGDPALGFHITKGFLSSLWGGRPIPKTYACSAMCIGPAIEHTLDEAQEKEG